MSDLIAISHPYAKAAFDFSIDNQNVDHWQNMLELAAEITTNKQMALFLSRNVFSPKVTSELFITICGNQIDKYFQNLILIMAENKHIYALPSVLNHFINFRTARDFLSEVKVISARILSETQLLKIKNAIERRFSRKVQLNYEINKNLIAGIIIKINNTVIDGSLQGRIERFANFLQS